MNTTEPRLNPAKPARAADLTIHHAGGRLYAVNGHKTGSAAGWAIEGVDPDYRMDGEHFVFVTVWVGTRMHPEVMVGMVLSPSTPVRAATGEDVRNAIGARLAERKNFKKSSRRG